MEKVDAQPTSPPEDAPTTMALQQTTTDKAAEAISKWQPPQYSEHPEGEEIVKQVEYYFSDENLPNDRYLLDKTGGKENKPVTLKTICGFPRMRKYKPYRSVVESLKKSKLLEIVDDKYIKRRVPLAIAPTVSAGEIQAAKEADQKKKGYVIPADQPWMTKGMMRPTGFEEFFADAPVTPATFKEEQSLYDRRIETAIQRYRARRKFHQQTAQVFNKFMNYGGIECGPKMFGGSDNKDLAEMDAAEIAASTAVHFVSEDVMCSDRWEVDFVGVVKGFLQVMATRIRLDSGQADIARATNVVRNFYNYLLHHNVCPEFETQILAARKICDLADVELFNILVVQERLPGPFNTAVSATHGGTVAGVYGDDQDWDDIGTVDRTLQDCRDILKFAISAHGSQQQYDRVVDVEKFETVYQEQISLEVTKVEMADETIRALYAAAREQKPFLATLGKLHCCRWSYPLAPSFEQSEEALRRQQIEHTMTLWVEEDLLQYCAVGMKIEGEIRELDIGIKWLDQVRAVGPSFFEWLPNELYGKQKAMKAEEEAQQQNSQVLLEDSNGFDETGVIIEKTGGTEVLQYKTDLAVPEPKEGQVLVKNDYVGINYIDTYPYMLGREAEGTIVAIGPDSPQGFKAGDRIVYLSEATYAEYTAAPAAKAIKIPSSIEPTVASAALLQGLTALTLIREAYHVQKGDWILVHAAAGGVGLWLCQLLAAVGAKTIATASTPEKLELAKKAGAEVLINYSHEDVKAKVDEVTNKQGVAAVFDGVGKDTFDLSLDCLARKGTMASFGNASGAVPPFAISRLTAKNAKVLRPTLFNYIATREEFETYTNELFDFIVKDKMDVRIHNIYDLKDVASAHQDIEGRKTTGKLLLKP
ncbi:hypothetical protein E4T42_01231 [Aureobasidium subglaciale]|nr:hypothetical protein E4T42_01231 [Aureobasidium subglaciale]